MGNIVPSKTFTNAKECTCRPIGPCKVHVLPIATICNHCRNPQEGMWFECSDCVRRRAALEEVVKGVKKLFEDHGEYLNRSMMTSVARNYLRIKMEVLDGLAPTQEKTS